MSTYLRKRKDSDVWEVSEDYTEWRVLAHFRTKEEAEEWILKRGIITVVSDKF